MLLPKYTAKSSQERDSASDQDVQVLDTAVWIQDTVILTLKDRMDIFSAPMLMREFNELIEQGARSFVVNLSNVRFVDADGDYPLLHLLKCAQEYDGTVTLVCPPGNPIRVFYEMMRLDTLFEVEDTMETVLTRLEATER